MRKERKGMIKLKMSHMRKKLKYESSFDSDESVSFMDSDDITTL